MKITISGTPGSGKTSVGKLLAEELKLRYYGIGKIARKIADTKKMSLIEFSSFLKKNKFYDKKFNDQVKKLDNHNNFVLDSRVGFLFIKGIHIFLDSDLNLRAERIFKDKRKLEKYKTIESVRNEIKKRLDNEKKSIKDMYSVDFTNPKHYDLIINTTGMTIRKVYNIIRKYLIKEEFL